MPTTKKPCPGCGTTSRRDVEDLLCFKCKRYIAWAKERQASDLEDRSFSYLRLPAPDAPITCFKGDYRQTPLLAKALNDLLSEIEYKGNSVPSDYGNTPFAGWTPNYRGDRAMYVETRFIDPLRALWWAIRQIAHSAYDEGKRDGTNLLVRLADGELGIKDFEERRLRQSE